MSRNQAPGVGRGEDALSGATESLEPRETALVLGGIGVGVSVVVVLGWAIARLISP
jgi:hypothetical protein